MGIFFFFFFLFPEYSNLLHQIEKNFEFHILCAIELNNFVGCSLELHSFNGESFKTVDRINLPGSPVKVLNILDSEKNIKKKKKTKTKTKYIGTLSKKSIS